MGWGKGKDGQGNLWGEAEGGWRRKGAKGKMGAGYRVGEGKRGQGMGRRDWIGRGLIRCKQVYAILDEVFLAGEIEETSKQVVLSRLELLDKLE